MTVVFGLGTRLRVHMRTTCENGVLRNGVMSSGGAPTPAGTSVFTKHSWKMGMGYLWLNGWGINHLMGGAFMGIL